MEEDKPSALYIWGCSDVDGGQLKIFGSLARLFDSIGYIDTNEKTKFLGNYYNNF